MIARLLIALLRGYKKYISPHLGHHCRFIPTCSEYAMQALAVHGLVKGLILTVWRLLRCQPFAKFGYDPVPEKGKWVNPERRLTRSRDKRLPPRGCARRRVSERNRRRRLLARRLKLSAQRTDEGRVFHNYPLNG